MRVAWGQDLHLHCLFMWFLSILTMLHLTVFLSWSVVVVNVEQGSKYGRGESAAAMASTLTSYVCSLKITGHLWRADCSFLDNYYFPCSEALTKFCSRIGFPLRVIYYVIECEKGRTERGFCGASWIFYNETPPSQRPLNRCQCFLLSASTCRMRRLPYMDSFTHSHSLLNTPRY